MLPGVRSCFFVESAGHAGYVQLKPPLPELKAAIGGHAEFQTFNQKATQRFAEWRAAATKRLQAFGAGGHPKALIETLAEDLLAGVADVPLIDAYDVYQHLMDYWAATMQDDAYLIAADGWVAKTRRILETDKKGKTKDRGWTCELDAEALDRGALLRPGTGRAGCAAGRAGCGGGQPDRAGGRAGRQH